MNYWEENRNKIETHRMSNREERNWFVGRDKYICYNVDIALCQELGNCILEEERKDRKKRWKCNLI